MAVTQNSYVGNGSTTNYSFTFPYLKSSDVKAQIDATVTTAFTLPNATTVQFNTAPANGAKIKIYRETDDSALAATFYAGSAVKSEDLNDNFTQNLYSTQEVTARYLSNLGGTMVGDLTLDEDADIIFEGATADAYETRLTVADPTADRTITLPNETGTVLTTASTNTVDSDQYVDGSIDLVHMSANSVDSDQLVDGSIDLVHMSANSVDSDQYVDGSIDLIHMSANSVDSDQYVDGSIDLVHMSANSVDSDQYVDGSIDLVHMSANSVDSDQYVDGSIDTVHIGDNQVTIDKIDDAVIVTAGEQSGVTANDSTFFTTSAADARYFNVSTGDTIKDGDAFPDNDTTIATTAAINDRIVDLVDDVGGFVPIANETSFPNANPDVNNGTGTIVSISTLASNQTSNGSGVITISNGTVGNSTVTINGAANSTTYNAGFGLLVETTTTLNTYTFHRLVPKATEVTTVAGKATEIGRLGTADAVADMNTLGTAAIVEDMNLLGTSACVADMALLGDAAVIADMELLGTTACIADMATIADTSNLIANIGTVAGNNANVTTAATNISGINNFAERYRVASSAPTSSLDEGDLYFNTTNNKLYRYDGSAWGEAVTATDGFVTDSDLAAWTGTTNVTTLGTIGTGTWNATAIAQAKIDDEAINEAKIQISNDGENGQFLSKQSGNTGGLTWATPVGASTGETYVKLKNDSGTLSTNGENTCAGYTAGDKLTSTAEENTLYGSKAGADLTTGDNNTIIGYQAGEKTTTSNGNTVVGRDALNVNETGAENTCIGNGSLKVVTGDNNTAVGSGAGDSIESGTNNTCIGYAADASSATVDNEITLGNTNVTKFRIPGLNFSLKDTTATDNYVLTVDANGDCGWEAASSSLEGTAVLSTGESGGSKYLREDGDGTCSWQSFSLGTGKQAVTLKAANVLSDTGTNTYAGSSAGESLGSGSYHNTFFGEEAGKGVDDEGFNSAFGAKALAACTSGSSNVAVGQVALRDTTSGGYNVAVGNNTLLINETGSSHVAIGYQTLDAMVSNHNNTGVGYHALTASTGSNNTSLGYKAGDSISSGTNNTCIGHEADASSSTATNEITLGDSSVSTLRCQVTSISSLSDKRDKTDINTLDLGLDFVNDLKPVKFKWQSREGIEKDGTYEAGFIAQDFQQIQKDNDAEYLNMVLESNPDKLEAAPGKLIPILVRAVQELSAEVNTLKNIIEETNG